MVNEDAVRDLMLYIDSHIELKHNGSVKKIKMRVLLCDEYFQFNRQEERNPPYGKDDLISAFRYCELKKYILVQGPEKVSNAALMACPRGNRKKCTGSQTVVRTPAHQLIYDILPAGQVFLNSVRDKTLWEKIKALHLFDKLSSLVSAGNTVADALRLLGL